MALPAATIFLGAFLLFQVQPLMGKFLLPWYGGGPGVWTACLLFFQGLLLGGYAYAHWLTTRLTVQRQTAVHLALLLLALACVPVRPGEGWRPDGTGDPLGQILLTLAATVGLPYFVLSATGPLVQRWVSLADPAASPYRLYALSNAGSLLALLSFPFVFEPLASRSTLSLGWSAGLVVFAGLCAACAWRLRGQADDFYVAGVADPGSGGPGSATPATTPDARPETPEPNTETPTSDRIFWFALPAAASLLLVAATNKMCQDIAAVPFLWILPLAVYLLTFILCFDHPRWYSRRWCSALLAAGALATAGVLSNTKIPLPVQVSVYVLTLFGGCMVAHGELHRLRPPPRRLTGFYLTIAAGGATGSLIVALLAPLVLAGYHELQAGLVLLVYLTGGLSLLQRSRSLAVGVALGLMAGTFIVPALDVRETAGIGPWIQAWAQESFGFYGRYRLEIGAVLLFLLLALHQGRRVGVGAWRRPMSAVPFMASLLFSVIFLVQTWQADASVRAAARNFYGAYRVHLYHEDSAVDRFSLLSHNGTTHGLQFSHPDLAAWATSYYGATSGAGRALDSYPGTRRVGVVGLGAGSLAVYGRAGDVMRFYEIDPAIVRVAETSFTYLRHSQARIEIVQGDARLMLEDELRRGESQQFDLLLLDAFSGDAIPVHLLTREALALYLRHLRPGGIIAVHVSNRHLDLGPVVAGLARHHRLHFATISDVTEESDWWVYNSTWMLLTSDPARLEPARLKTVELDPADATLPSVDWTDDHASLFSVLK